MLINFENYKNTLECQKVDYIKMNYFLEEMIDKYK